HRCKTLNRLEAFQFDLKYTKLEAHKLRSKANLIQHNEKSLDFFFSSEKQRGKNKLWHHIKTDSGTIKYDKDKLESNLNITELDNVIKTFKRGKSPGEDGITAEWYQFFWDIIREEIHD
ncbi:YTX2-like protein, partial [Mya arenaria]